MAHRNIAHVLTAALAVAGIAACHGDSNPPQTAADQTRTTAGTANQPDTESSHQTTSIDQPGLGTPGVTSPSGPSANVQGNMNVSTPMATTGVSASSPDPTSAIGTNGGSGNAATGAGTGAGSSVAADRSTIDDPQILAVLHAADSGEIDQAREALRRSKNPRVKHFATHMMTDHSAAETKLSAIESRASITPQASAMTEELKSSGQTIAGHLRAASADDFDKVYIDAQVDEHDKVLDLLDNKLLPRAQNADLVKALREIRTKVSGHLKEAQEIQTSLQNK